MDAELLKLYEKLQPLFAKKMGPIQSGDRVYRKCTVFGEPIDEQIWPKDKMFEIVIVREQSSINSYWHCQNEKGEERLLTDQEMLVETCTRLPLPIDPVNPERGLLGMLKGDQRMWSVGDRWWVAVNIEVGVKEYIEGEGDSPTEALLKALIATEDCYER